MSITNKELARRALALLAGGDPNSPWFYQEAEAGLAIPYAMHRLGEETARNPQLRGLLQQDYSVTISSGVGNPLTATGSLTSAADVLYDSIVWGQVKDADNNRLIPVQNRMDFERPLQPGFKYYCLTGQRIYVRSAVSNVYESDLGDVTGPLTITANFVPTVSALPANGQFDDDIVRILADILVLKFPDLKAANIPARK